LPEIWFGSDWQFTHPIASNLHPTIFTAWVGFGVTFYALWMFSQLAVLSWADLSYVLPITSIGYALAAFAGWLFLGDYFASAPARNFLRNIRRRLR
jgi:hypothetical protein